MQELMGNESIKIEILRNNLKNILETKNTSWKLRMPLTGLSVN